RATHADHLVVHEVGRHAHEVEVAPALTDDFVARRKGNQVREAFERGAAAVGYVLFDRGAQREDRHGPSLHDGARLFALVLREVVERGDRLAGRARTLPAGKRLIAGPGAGRRTL